jgi:hypothetical protein
LKPRQSNFLAHSRKWARPFRVYAPANRPPIPVLSPTLRSLPGDILNVTAADIGIVGYAKQI